MRFKLKACLAVLLSSILICTVSIQANSTPSDIQKYIDDLSLIQQQIFTLTQYIVFPQSEDAPIEAGLNHINTALTTVNTKLNTALSKSTEEPHTRELRLLLNVVNYMYNSLYELELLTKNDSQTEKLLILQNYFNFRVYASNTLNFVKNLLSTS